MGEIIDIGHYNIDNNGAVINLKHVDEDFK